MEMIADENDYHHWNYRVIRSGKDENSFEYKIHSVHYCDGKATLWSSNPLYAMGASVDDLKADLEVMLKALSKPVLVESACGRFLKEEN